MAKTWMRRVGPAIGVVLFALALGVLHHQAQATDMGALKASIRALSWSVVVVAVACTAVGYLILTFYDQLACRHAGHPLPWRRVVLASFIGHSFTHTLGNAILVGGSVRYRLYSACGLSAVHIALVIGFCVIGFWVGFLALCGAVFLIEPPPTLAALRLPFSSLPVMGACFLLVPLSWLVLCSFVRAPLRIRGWSLRLPTPLMSGAQIALGAAEMVTRSLVLYVLLPPELGLGFAAFLGSYLLAMVAGKISQIPGGLGVLEGVFVMLLPTGASPAGVLGALAVYRGIYYLVPLLVAALALGGFEIAMRRRAPSAAPSPDAGWFGLAVRHLMASVVAIGAAILVVGAMVPTEPVRAQLLSSLVPVAVQETAFVLSGAVGMVLMFAARGLQRKLRPAWNLSVILLAVGAVLALARGMGWEEATALSLLLIALLPCRRDFHRGVGLGSVEFIPGWSAATAMLLVAAAGCGWFAFKPIDWSWDLLTTFGPGDDAARALRAFAAAASVAAVVAILRLVRPAFSPPSARLTDVDRAATIAEHACDALAHLALLGDKQLLFSASGEGFLMYRVEGRSWVALGDPIGPLQDRRELAWSFRDLCDHHDGRPVFYQARECELYADLGLTQVRIGDEARVPLPFYAPGSAARVARLADLGFEFEVVGAERTLALLPELKRVDEAWADTHTGAAHGFDHGHFDPTWISRFSVAVVRWGGSIVAFATVWTAPARTEMNLDLVRIVPDAPPALLEGLFDAVMAWGKENAYAWFSFGLVPMPAVGNLPCTVAAMPVGTGFGRRMFAHGEHFATLGEVRAFSARFDPVYEPRWLLSRETVHVPGMIRDIVALVAPGSPPGASAPLAAVRV
ncbi:MAG: bifunctional lysylphosphatidylglycerol flippase/synthetase MprF [Planctomycetes bacterium]|nr:bifunctional lysylphosphatidylglycerol flippase/synthetase MprF [Planctomycetota bacterium]